MKARKSLRVVSLYASSLVVYCPKCNLNVLYLHDSTQCYKQRTTLVQPSFVVCSLRILNSLKTGFSTSQRKLFSMLLFLFRVVLHLTKGWETWPRSSVKTIETRVYFWSVSLCWSLKRSILMLKFERKPEAQIKKKPHALRSVVKCEIGPPWRRRVKGIISHKR